MISEFLNLQVSTQVVYKASSKSFYDARTWNARVLAKKSVYHMTSLFSSG